MTTKHIPGPWKVIEREVFEDGSVYPRHILGGYFDMEVCQMEGAASAHAFANNPDWKGLGQSEMAMATARLIAAAPELLDALQLCEGNISSLAAAHPKIYGEWLAVVRAAIAKAVQS